MLDLVRSGYFDGIANVEKPSVTAVGKNLFDSSNRVDGQRFDQTTGNFVASATNFYTPNYISIKPNTTYNYSFSASIDLRIIYYDANKTFISGLLISTIGTSDARTTPSNAYYVRLSTGISKIDTLQLEQGSTATTYEPYKSSTLTIDTELRSLPNGVRDRVYEQNGELWLEKRVEEYVLVADDIVSLFTSTTNVDVVGVFKKPNYIHFNTAAGASTSVLFPNFPNLSYADNLANVNTYAHNFSVSNWSLVFAKGTYANLAAAKTALTGTVVQYQLATPQLINLTQEGKVDGELIAFENGTIYNTSESFHADISFDVASNRSAQITGLLESASYQAKQIENKADLIHTHPISDVVNLQTSLDGKVAKTGDTITGILNFTGVDKVHLQENGVPLISTFKHPTGSTAIPVGQNTFVGKAGNTTMGSTATLTSHGSYNTGVGNGALISLTTGNFNTAIGLDALRTSTTGSNNTAVGAFALRENMAGQNTSLGYYAGGLIADSSQNINGSNSVFIGHFTKALADNQTNQIVIGHTATGNGSNTATIGNDSITATYLKGAVSATTSVTTPSVVATSTVKIGNWVLSENGTSGSLDFVIG
jgi:hypothetical protein